MSKSTVRLQDWKVMRNEQMVVGPLDIAFLPGEITVLMGPSGVGKTTALLSLLGYSEKGLTTKGVRHEGTTCLRPGELLHQATVYIPQAVPFNPNWEVGSFLCRLPWGERRWWHDFWPETPSRRRVVVSVLSQLGMEKRMRATVAELSGGEIQRASLAQLLLLKPSFFAADELATGLDPGIAQWVLAQCRSIVQSSQGAAVMAMHDVFSALQIADQIALLWPAKLNASPWVLRKGDSCWEVDLLHSLLCLARWTHEFGESDGVRQLVGELRSSLVQPPAVGGGVTIFKSDGKTVSVPISSCQAGLQEKLRTEHSEPVRYEEARRVFIGLTWPVKNQENTAALAEIPLEIT